MFSVGADGKHSAEVIPNLLDGTETDFRPIPENLSAIVRIEMVGTAVNAV